MDTQLPRSPSIHSPRMRAGSPLERRLAANNLLHKCNKELRDSKIIKDYINYEINSARIAQRLKRMKKLEGFYPMSKKTFYEAKNF